MIQTEVVQSDGAQQVGFRYTGEVQASRFRGNVNILFCLRSFGNFWNIVITFLLKNFFFFFKFTSLFLKSSDFLIKFLFSSLELFFL